MRMDRYDEELKSHELKQTRTNKNQELYTDVYLNNVYVDINNLKDVMNQEVDEEKEENIKIIKETVPVDYSYEDKNYDIAFLIDEAIKNKKEDNVKRSLDFNATEDEIASLIESINENQKEENEDDDNLLSELMPNSDNTTVIPPLEEPILDTSLIETQEEKENKDEVSHDMLDDDISEKDLESDNSFVEEKSSKLKIIIPILVILLIVGIIIGVLIYKDII